MIRLIINSTITINSIPNKGKLMKGLILKILILLTNQFDIGIFCDLDNPGGQRDI